MATDLTIHRPRSAIALKVIAIFLFTVMAALIKATSQYVPPGQAVFFRSLCAMPVIICWLAMRRELQDGLVAVSFMGHFWRGLLGTLAMFLNFAALGLLPLPDVTAIGYATPLFAVIFAAVFLRERVRVIRISAVVLGLVGVLIVIAPRLSIGSETVGAAAGIGAIVALSAAIIRAMVQIHVRRMVKTEKTAAIVFYFSMTATLISFSTLPIGWITDTPVLMWTAPPFWVLGLLMLSGLIGGVAQILITSSYRFGEAAMLAPFDYTSMLFAVLLGLTFFDERPSASMLEGSALVIAGGILIIWRERQLALNRKKQKPNVSTSETTG